MAIVYRIGAPQHGWQHLRFNIDEMYGGKGRIAHNHRRLRSLAGAGSSADAAETLSLRFKRKRRRVQSRRCTWLAGIRRRWRRRRRRRTVCRRVQFLEPLFTNRITAIHRDQKLLVMEYGARRRAAYQQTLLVSSNQCTECTNFGSPVVPACTGTMSAAKNNRLVYMRNTADA